MKSYNLRNSGGLYTVGYFPDPVTQISKMTMRKSTDDGVSWNQFTLISDTNSYGYCVLPNPQDSRVIYVGGYVYPTSGAYHPVLFKTTDAGATWNRIATSVINQQGDMLNVLECDKTNANKVFAGTSDALYLSTDAGSTWSCVTTSVGYLSVSALVIDPTNSNNVFVATTNGVLLSTNGGTTWRTFNENLTSVYVESIEYDAANMMLYVGTKNGGVFRRNLATLGVATTIVSTSGNSQSARVSTSLANPCVVTVTDAGGNPISGVSVSFAIASTPSGATGQSLSTSTTTTNGSGQASTVLTLGNKAGTYTVTATSGSLSGSPVTFTATGIAGSATTIVSMSGNSQSARINTSLANPCIVTVTDAGGNPVSGVSVSFAIVSAPSGATGQLLSTTATTTNGSGQASTVLTLGSKVGTYTVAATSGGLSGSPVTFTATGIAGAATTIVSTSGDSQSARINTSLANPCVVTVTDAGGNPVSGVSVSFASASAPSGATGQSLSTSTTTTNGSGQASTVLTLGNKAGTYTVTATSGSLSGSPVTFTATGTNPVPTLTSLSANRAGRGSKINVALTGTNFLQGVTTVSFGADITVNSVSIVSASQIMVNISISGSAVTGTRDVSVTNASPGGGTATLGGGFTIDTSTPTSVEAMVGAIPGEYALHDAYPNPFNPSTTIRYDLPEASEVTLRVYNGLGQVVATLVDEHKEAGYYQVQWQANIPSGIYMCRMQALRTDGGRATTFVMTKKIVFLK